MSDYLVKSDRTELPQYTSFTTTCGYPYKTGTLVAFQIGSRMSIGRWLPNIGGYNWILQPGRLICLVGCAIRILGKVVIAAHIAAHCLN